MNSNVFQPTPGDLSLQYLEQIFGTVTLGNLLPIGESGLGGPVSVLGVMFQSFNTIILSVASMIIVYMTVVGVLMTAHEGEFMKKWNSLWAPLRAVFGIASLFPTATGYSSLQVLMMWVIVNGVGAADQLWTTALQYVNTMGSVYAQGQAPTAGIKTTFTNLFKSLVCEQTALYSMDMNTKTLNNNGLYFCFVRKGGVDDYAMQDSQDPFCVHNGTRLDYNQNIAAPVASLTPAQAVNTELDQMVSSPGVQTFGPSGGCGKLYYCDPLSACLKPDGTNYYTPPPSDNYDTTPALSSAQATANSDFVTLVSQGPPPAPTPSNANTQYQTVPTNTKLNEYNAKLDVAVTCGMCIAQINSIAWEVWALRQVAATYTANDYQYTYYYYNGNGTSGGMPGGAQYCSDKGVQTSKCFGAIDYDYSTQTPQATGKDNTQSQGGVASAQANIGALPDPKLGSDGPSIQVITEVLWPYVLRPAYWDLSKTPAQNAESHDPIQVNTNQYITDINTASQAYHSVLTMYNQGKNAAVNGAIPAAISGASDSAAVRGSIAAILSSNFSGGAGAGGIVTAPANFVFGVASQQGWIMAGGYYYYLVQNNGHQMTTSLPRLNMLSLNPSSANDESGYSNIMSTYRNNYAAATVLAKLMANDSPTSLGGSSMDSFSDAGAGAQGALVNATNINTQTNPLIQVASQGYMLLKDAEIIFSVFILASFVLGLVSGLSVSVLGTGFTNPAAVAVPLIMSMLVPLMGMVLGIMVSTGATLCVYVPLIPYMIFSFGAVGWMISTVEVMVAGPLVSLGIIAPGGNSEMLGKAEPALMLLFGVFLRPSLMIFGLIASMLISCVAVELINQAFWPLVYTQISTLATTGGASMLSTSGFGPAQPSASTIAANPLMTYFFLIAYVGILVAVLNKSFAAIALIPEKVMRWVSGHGESHGEMEALGGVKGAVDSEASKVGGKMEGAGGAMEQKGRTTAESEKARGKRKENAEANKPTTKGS